MVSKEVLEIYKEIERERKKSLYELFCDFSYKILRIKLTERKMKEEERIIKFSLLKIPPTSNISAAILFFIFSILAIFLISFFINFSYFFPLFFMFGFFSFSIYYYPYLRVKIVRAQASSEMAHCITYMVISLSQLPNLENAVLLAYKNLKGPIREDLGKILHDFISQKIYNFEDGLNEVAEKWYVEAREFSEALKLLISYSKNPYQGERLLDEATNLVIEDSYQRMEKYARELKLPTTAIMVLGLVLPVIGLTLIPLMTIFLPELLDIIGVFFIYDIFLPTILLILIMFVINGRPLVTSPIELDKPILTFNFFGKQANIFPLLLILALTISIIFVPPIYSHTENFKLCSNWMNEKFEPEKKPEKLNLDAQECSSLMSDLKTPAIMSATLLVALVLIFTLPIIFYTNSIIEKMKKTRRIESEIDSVLLQISHSLKIGAPFEKSIISLSTRSKVFEIEELFKELKDSILLGESLNSALFNKKTGILRKYNSVLLTSVFRIIVDISSRGSIYLSQALSTISRYLKKLSSLQNKIEDLVSDNVSTIKFMCFFLNPIVTGVATALGLIIMGILISLSLSLGRVILPEEVSGIPSIGLPIFDIWKASRVSPAIFQLVIGIYLIEVSIISGILIVGLETGFDLVVWLDKTSKILLVSTILFVVISIIIYVSLSGMIISIFEVS
ncbi:MAG: hypothetical protein QW040_00540 [Candidatus Aenigmatarchaeota archaeon]